MTPKWQKSLSASEIDDNDCHALHTSWGGGSDRCCFSSMKISLNACLSALNSKSPDLRMNPSSIKGSPRLCWRYPYRQKSLSLSRKHTFLLAFSSLSHLLTPLLITVRDSAQPAATINTRFLLSQNDFYLSPAGERERLIRLRNAIFEVWTSE